MKKVLVCLLVLIVFVYPFQTVAQAETTQDLNDFKQFDSFMKRYHEHSAELAYYVTTSYDSNNHYFRENFDLFRNAINSIYDTNKSEFLTKYLDNTEDLFAKPLALLGTANDLRRFTFDKIKSFFSTGEEYHSYVYNLPPGYHYHIEGDERIYTSYSVEISVPYWSIALKFFDGASARRVTAIVTGSNDINYTVWKELFDLQYEVRLHHFLPHLETFGEPRITIRSNADRKPIEMSKPILPPALNNVVNNVTNNFNEGRRFDENYTPSVVPQLVCPEETIDIQYDDGVFYTKARTIETLLVAPDETVHFNGVACNLDFKFPTLELDELTGDVTADGQSLVRIPSLPSEPPEDYDNTLLGYIRNSYEYATTVVSTGVQGLRTVTIGFVGITTLAGSVFAFLPPEILTFITGAFLVTVGLWVVKK